MAEPSPAPHGPVAPDPGAALRAALLGCGAVSLVLAVIASSLLYLSGTRSSVAWPVVTLLGGGQLFALLGAVSAGWSVLSMRGQPTPARVTSRVARHLGLLQRGILAWCVLGATVWVIARPAIAVATLLLAAVAAQVALALSILGRRLRST